MSKYNYPKLSDETERLFLILAMRTPFDSLKDFTEEIIRQKTFRAKYFYDTTVHDFCIDFFHARTPSTEKLIQSMGQAHEDVVEACVRTLAEVFTPTNSRSNKEIAYKFED